MECICCETQKAKMERFCVVQLACVLTDCLLQKDVMDRQSDSTRN